MKSSIVGDIDLTSEPLLGARFDEIDKRLDAQEAGEAEDATSGALDVFPTGVASYRREKKGVFPNITYTIQGDIRKVKTIIVQRSLAVSQNSYDGLKLVGTDKDISDLARSAGTVDLEFNDVKGGLDYATQYDIIEVIGNSGAVHTPIDEPDFTNYPANVLLAFTTPEQFNTPSAPAANLIVYNRLDDQTADIYDAIVGLLQFAPLTDSGVAQSYRVAGVIEAGSILTRLVTGQPDERLRFQRTLDETELDQIADGLAGRPLSTPANRGYVIIPCPGLPPGRLHTWVENFIRTLTTKKRTTGSVAFRAANLQVDITQLTNTSLTVTAPDSTVTDGKHIQFNLEFTQPNNVAGAASTVQPVALKNATLKFKKTSASIYTNIEDRWNAVQADIYHTQVNTGTITGSTGSLIITGSGTVFTKLQAGWKIRVGAQTLTIADTPTSDTSLTVTALPSSNFTASTYSVIYVVPITQAKVKPSTGYSPGAVLILRARGDAKVELTRNFTTDADGNVVNDTGVPVFSVTPTLKHKKGKLMLVAAIDVELGASNTITVRDRWELSINDGSNSLNIGDPESESIVSGIAFYGVEGPRVKVPADRDHLLRIFGASASLRAKFAATNDFGRTESTNSANMPLSGLQDVTTLYNPINRVKNGHFHNSDGTIATHWQDYDPRSGTFGDVDQTGKLRADLAAHRAKWRDTTTQENQRFLVQNRGQRWRRGEWFSCIWNMYSNGTPTIDEVAVGLFTQKTLANNISGSGTSTTGTGFLNDGGADSSTGVHVGSIIGNGTEWRTVTVVTDTVLTMDRAWTTPFGPVAGVALILQSDRLRQTNLALTTADKFQKGKIMTLADLDVSQDIYFVVVLRDVVDTTTFPFIDAICINPGQESAGYQESVEEFELGFGGTENFDTAPDQGSSSIGGQPPGATSGEAGVVQPIQY